MTTEIVLPSRTGPRGYSAYEIAVQNGFVGTEEEWLASLGGDAAEAILEVADAYKLQAEAARDAAQGYESLAGQHEAAAEAASADALIYRDQAKQYRDEAEALVGFDPSVITVTGAGLATGGGTLEASRVLTVTEANETQSIAQAADNVVVTPRRGPKVTGTIKRVVLTANATLDESHRGHVIEATNSITLSTLSAVTLGDGWTVFLRNSGEDIVTLDPNGTETVDAKSSISLYPGERFRLYSDGANFHTIGRASRVLVQTESAAGLTVVAFEAAFADPEARRFDLEWENLRPGNTGGLTFSLKFGGNYNAGTAYTYISGWTDDFGQSGTTPPSHIGMQSGSFPTNAPTAGTVSVINPLGTTAASTQVIGLSIIGGTGVGLFGGSNGTQSSPCQGIRANGGVAYTAGTFRLYICRE